MSDRNPIVAAVDAGTNTTICLIGKEHQPGKAEIIGYSMVASAGIRRGVILNVDETADAIRTAVTEASKRANCDIQKLYVNLSGQKFRTIDKTLKKSIEAGKIITKADIKAMYEQVKGLEQVPGEKIFHIINQAYSIDGETGISNPIGAAGNEMNAEYKVVVGPVSYEENLKSSLKRAGFEMVRAIVNPVASAESVLTEDEKEAGVVVVDLGGGTTTLSVFYENVLRYMSVIPFGGNMITFDIKEGCSILLRHAELLKVKWGQALGDFAPANRVVTIPGLNGFEPKEISCKSLAYIIQARLEEIFESVHYQIGKSGFADKLGAGIVLTGGGAKLEKINQLVRFKTGMDVRIGYPIFKLNPEQEKVLESPQFATVFGLLIKALRDENAQNEELIARKRKKPKLNFGTAVVEKLTLFFNEEDSEL
ncbi:MAG TPA: cell division protein FtsA [Prolixibacteraceae bacterium]|nr:cell division protein FtsA [Prolixibacteraceae bacterium]